MKIILLEKEFCICKVENLNKIDFSKPYTFFAKTNEENSLVVPIENLPQNTLALDKGWKGFYLDGILDFSLIGILSKISTILAQNNIGLFAISTYNTDYIFVKKENFSKALQVLKENDFEISL